MKKYSILIPIHNEVYHIPLLLKSLTIFSENGHQIIIIDDGSDDGSTNILESYDEIDLVCLNENMGKGSAIKEGLKRVVNNRIILFDGDMELKSSDISKLMILDKGNSIDFVMGYRFKSLSPLKSNLDWGNFMFTSFFNLIFSTNYKDILCCAKSFNINAINKYEIYSKGFDIDVELASVFTILSKRKRIAQVLLSYERRGIQDGKKLKISDGWIILSRIINMIRYK
ncbi:MAG: hypothetical protein CMC63_11130 [Flavobacteriaceae bacterium]|nr:hypothetical protein [Flavobacteriaceae bacterium]|tara:strand:- start:2982 stop:3662 length:681 start_codon:yes stop_codon:yes gene_type:complete